MRRFERELENNNFMCSECHKCKKIVWPPSDFCSACFGLVGWRMISREGCLLEFSQKNGEWFGIAEFEGQIRILGTIIDGNGLEIGQKVYLEKCGYDGGEKFLFRAKKD